MIQNDDVNEDMHGMIGDGCDEVGIAYLHSDVEDNEDSVLQFSMAPSNAVN